MYNRILRRHADTILPLVLLILIFMFVAHNYEITVYNRICRKMYMYTKIISTRRHMYILFEVLTIVQIRLQSLTIEFYVTTCQAKDKLFLSTS